LLVDFYPTLATLIALVLLMTNKQIQ